MNTQNKYWFRCYQWNYFTKDWTRISRNRFATLLTWFDLKMIFYPTYILFINDEVNPHFKFKLEVHDKYD